MLQTTVGSLIWSPTWWQVVLDPKIRLRRLHSANTLPINKISGEFLSLDRRPMVVPSSLKTTLGVRFVGCVDGIDR